MAIDAPKSSCSFYDVGTKDDAERRAHEGLRMVFDGYLTRGRWRAPFRPYDKPFGGSGNSGIVYRPFATLREHKRGRGASSDHKEGSPVEYLAQRSSS